MDSLSEAPKPSALQQKKIPQKASPEDLRSEEAWIAFRSLALEPLEHSELVTNEQTRAEFIEGCRLLGLTFVFPHQLLIADVLNAGKRTNGALLPRQVGKTKTLTIITLGRCALRPKYNAAFTMTTAAGKAHEVFGQSVVDELEALWPDESTRPFKLYRAPGRAYVSFPNGSRFAVKSPKGASFRGSSYDLVWVDEAGEATLSVGEDILGAVMPAFIATAALRDYPPQLVATGTAGSYRKGQLLWSALQDLNGRLRYAFPDLTVEEDLASWDDRAGELVRAMHPGLECGLALEADIREFFELESTSVERFLREYGGIFGTDLVGDAIVSPEDWEAAGLDTDPSAVTPPTRFALAYGMDRDGKHGSVVAAWRDELGHAHLLSMKHRDGTDWVAEKVYELAQRYKVPVAYDTVNAFARSEADKLERARPRTKLHPQTTREVSTAAALLVDDAANGRVRHYRQPAMDDAAAKAVKRGFRQSTSWGIGPSHPDDDVSALEAAALALRLYDTETKEKRAVITTMRVG
ncbi:terminase large subunit domain-containing protein [Microbacterium sp. NPDC091662]|uniref:terminase large subunit domain-containing protein n=1 Tax=Microbacterium sp. NPDC091662 TaxID=3364211 RepID=UPI00380DFFBF